MSNWFIYNKKENYQLLNKYTELTDLQKIILANRDVVSESSVLRTVDSSYAQMYDPFLLKDMSEGVDIIFDHMMRGSHIRIVGDYDSDGVSSTTILMKGLGLFYDDLSYVIPDRIEDGYGINIPIVDKALQDNIGLIITCDNGIAAFDALEYAKEKGIDVVVTDHHQVVRENDIEKIPLAKAVINPSQTTCKYPFKPICGAVVAYKLVDALYRRYGSEFEISYNKILDLLQFAALGTVTDVMPLIDENRIIVVEGLKRLNSTNNPGLKELLYQLNWTKEINVYTIGFIIGPTINATGRLFTAKLAVELFLENDPFTLREYARELISLNTERKKITVDAVNDAMLQISQEKIDENDIMLLYMKDVHESICGLVAGRIKEKYNKPVIVFTDASSDEGQYLKGSGRSIEAYNMHAEMSKYRDYYVAFGGHKMACGLTIESSNYKVIQSLLNESSTLKQDDFTKLINIDEALDFRMITFDLVNQIIALEPFGNGFTKPKFASKNVIIRNIAVLGKDKNLLKAELMQNGKILEAISFNPDEVITYLGNKFNISQVSDRFDLLLGREIDIVYSLGINDFNGKSSIQLILEEIR